VQDIVREDLWICDEFKCQAM